MSRIRTVKPELFKHEDLFDAELASGLPLRLAFIGLFTVADCEGRFKWRPRTLKLEVLPHDLLDFAQVLNALERAGFIERYEVDGETYGRIPSFTKHQRIQTKELAAGSSIPAPVATNETGTHPVRTQERTGTHLESQEGKGREEEGKGREVIAHAPDTHEDRSSLPVAEATPVEAAAVEASGQGQEDFEAFWATYPKRAGGNPRTTALKAWNARCKDGHKASVIIDGARRYAAYCQATGKLDSEYVKQASTFLNQLSFLDPWNLPAQKAVLPRNNPIQQATTPETTEFDAIMRSLNRPMIEGKCHAAH